MTAESPRLRYERNSRTLIPQIRKMLRAQPVWSRAKMRESLRARGISGNAIGVAGGRRLYHALRWLRRTGEVELTPETVTAVSLMQPVKPEAARATRPSKRKLALERRKAVAQRAKKQSYREKSGINL